MKIPKSPPSISSLMKGLDAKALQAMAQARVGQLAGDAYLHWDQLRHRTPPPGLDLATWWLGIKLARQANAQPLPLLDKGGGAFLFGTPEPVQIHLHHIDQDAAGTLRSETEGPTPAHRDEYLLRSLVEESITSSQLEGASTTRRVAEAMLRERRKPRDHDERMIYNNFLAMRAIQDFRGENITPSRILDLHRRVTEGMLEDPADAGRLRTTDDIRVFNEENGILLHQPPQASELEERLERLCAFANAPETSRPFVHPVLRAILLHFMIGYDHPFVDGNGRTARALFYWSMLRSGYWLSEFISISNVLKKAPAQYGLAYLHTETDGSDTTYFLLHQLETIRAAIDALRNHLHRKAQERRTVDRLLAPATELGDTLNHRQRDLLAHALKHPEAVYTIAGHKGLHATVYQTARTDLLSLANAGLLVQGRRGRGFVFTVPEDLSARIQAYPG
ncbi:MAG: Fic family protein [Acidobacteria bacterium]|nr:Fic family protein [Acidobacteriota bacterium]